MSKYKLQKVGISTNGSLQWYPERSPWLVATTKDDGVSIWNTSITECNVTLLDTEEAVFALHELTYRLGCGFAVFKLSNIYEPQYRGANYQYEMYGLIHESVEDSIHKYVEHSDE